MSYSTNDWVRRDDEVRRTYGRDPDRSIYFPRANSNLQSYMDMYLEGRSLDPIAAYNHKWYPAEYNGPRIIIPCIRTDEKNFWQGRLIEWPSFEVTPAYKRWDSPRGPRGDALCYLRSAGASTMVLVEGPMDALAAAMTDASAIATLGVGAPGPVLAHVATIASSYKKVILVPDRDEVGAWMKIQHVLGTMGVVSEIREPSAKDLADLSPHKRKELIRD